MSSSSYIWDQYNEKVVTSQKIRYVEEKIINTYITKYFRCFSGGPSKLDTIYDVFLCCNEVLGNTWVRKLPSPVPLAFLPAHLVTSFQAVSKIQRHFLLLQSSTSAWRCWEAAETGRAGQDEDNNWHWGDGSAGNTQHRLSCHCPHLRAKDRGHQCHEQSQATAKDTSHQWLYLCTCTTSCFTRQLKYSWWRWVICSHCFVWNKDIP